MIVIGLTGGIGMGKSTAAKILRQMGFPVYNADKAVHDVLKKGGRAVKPVAKLFPAALKKGAIDRKSLARAVFADKRLLRRLEKIIHPLIRSAEREFLRKSRKAKKRAAILEIPLMFETGANKRCDIVLCVSAPPAVQKARVMSRPDMTEKKWRAIVARQMPEAQKRRRADYVVPTGKGLKATEIHLRKLFMDLLPP